MDKDGDGWISKNVSQKSIVFSNWVIIPMLNKSSNFIILKYPDIWPALSATSELDLIMFYANFKKDLWISSSTF